MTRIRNGRPGFATPLRSAPGEDGPDPLEVTTMPAGSSPKRERQYEHIRDSYEDRGVSAGEAEERAARTVNKQRAEHGEAKSTKKS